MRRSKLCECKCGLVPAVPTVRNQSPHTNASEVWTAASCSTRSKSSLLEELVRVKLAESSGKTPA